MLRRILYFFFFSFSCKLSFDIYPKKKKKNGYAFTALRSLQAGKKVKLFLGVALHATNIQEGGKKCILWQRKTNKIINKKRRSRQYDAIGKNKQKPFTCTLQIYLECAKYSK